MTKPQKKKQPGKPQNSAPKHKPKKSQDAPVSKAIHVASKGTQAIRLKGTDRFAHIPNLESFGEKGVVLDVPLVPASLPRLRNLAGSYQRIEWKKLVVRYEPMVPTAAVGGYVCGFIPDPEDDLQTGDPLERLLAHPGSKLTKIWQASTVVHKPLNDRLYTSQPPRGEVRLYSPGRVALVIDSAVSGGKDVKCPLSVYIDWEVVLMEPSLEAVVKAAPLEVGANFYCRSSNVGLWWKDGTGGDDPREKIPGLQFNQVYKAGSKRFMDLGSGADRVAGNWDRFILVNDATHGVTLAPVDYSGKTLLAAAAYNIFVLEKGDVLIPVAENSTVGLQYLQSTQSLPAFGRRQGPSSGLCSPLEEWCVV